jgi:hypothetical protein
MSPLTIGLSGRAGSGKDTMANFLTVKFEGQGKTVYVAAFADIMKKLMSDMYSVPLGHFYDRVLKEEVHPRMYGRSPRSACQWFGTDVVRNTVDKEFWYTHMQRQIADAGADVNIITDVRFLNEATKLMDDIGAIIYYVDADKRLGPIPVDAHESEREVYAIRDLPGSVCCAIQNDETVEKFIAQIDLLDISKRYRY